MSPMRHNGPKPRGCDNHPFSVPCPSFGSRDVTYGFVTFHVCMASQPGDESARFSMPDVGLPKFMICIS